MRTLTKQQKELRVAMESNLPHLKNKDKIGRSSAHETPALENYKVSSPQKTGSSTAVSNQFSNINGALLEAFARFAQGAIMVTIEKGGDDK